MEQLEAGILMGVVVLTLATIVVVTLIIQVMATWRARGQVAREVAYRELAEEANKALGRLLAGQEKIEQELTELRAQMQSIEKLLRTVE